MVLYFFEDGLYLYFEPLLNIKCIHSLVCKGSSINHVGSFLYIFDPLPFFVDHFTKQGLWSIINIWQTPSPFHDHIVYEWILSRNCTHNKKRCINQLHGAAEKEALTISWKERLYRRWTVSNIKSFPFWHMWDYS